MFTTRMYRLGTGLALVLALMVPLGGAAQGEPPDQGPVTGHSPELGTATQGGAGAQGGQLSVAFENDPGPLDPSQSYDSTAWVLERLLWDTLVTYDEGTTIVPGLAAEMPAVSDDGLTYTFDLRPDANFVRGGEVLRPVTAQDVVFSLNRLLRPDLAPSPSPVGTSFLSVIEGADAVLSGESTEASGIVALDQDTVRITLDRADRTFLNVLAMPFASILPAELAGMDTAAFAAAPVGSGPYILGSYVPGERAVFQRNPHYWRTGFPKADTIEVRFGVTPGNQLLQAESNQLDLMGNQILPADWPSVSTDPAYADRIVSSDAVQTFYLSMDTSGPDSPFVDPLVRQAVNHAIDKRNQVRIINGRATVAGCIFPTPIPGHDPSCDPYPFSVETAQKLMDQAGNTGFSTKLYTDDSDISRLSAEAIASDLAKIGITVEVQALDFKTLMGTVTTAHAAPMVYSNWYQDFPDPSDFIDPILSCASAVDGGLNWAWYCDEAVDAQAAHARTITDMAAAVPVYQDIERQIMADAPWVPILYPRWTVLRSERVPDVTQLHPVWFWDLAAYPVAG